MRQERSSGQREIATPDRTFTHLGIAPCAKRTRAALAHSMRAPNRLRRFRTVIGPVALNCKFRFATAIPLTETIKCRRRPLHKPQRPYSRAQLARAAARHKKNRLGSRAIVSSGALMPAARSACFEARFRTARCIAGGPGCPPHAPSAAQRASFATPCFGLASTPSDRSNRKHAWKLRSPQVPQAIHDRAQDKRTIGGPGRCSCAAMLASVIREARNHVASFNTHGLHMLAQGHIAPCLQAGLGPNDLVDVARMAACIQQSELLLNSSDDTAASCSNVSRLS